MIYFTADWHLFHTNIIKYTNRPFNNIEEMNETLIKNYNSVVKKSDTCYFLGDMAFGFKNYEIFRKLNGTKHLIKGNHDDRKVFSLTNIFESISDIKEITIEKQPIVLCHYAMRVWSRKHYGSYMLYGHSHGTLERDLEYPNFDVGVDTKLSNYYPISFEQIKTYVKENYEKIKY